MTYIIAPLDKVKGVNSMPEFGDVLKALQDAAIARAEAIWTGYKFGGVYPGDNQFGICPLRKNEMAHDVTSTTLSGSYSFRKNLGSTGWHTLFDYTVRKDVIHAIAGFIMTDEVLRLLELRMELGDRKYPILDIQEAKSWNRFALLIKEDIGEELIAQEETSVYIRGYVEATGYQNIVPLGFMLYKRKDLVISET
jgi:hypothetical protein